VAVAVATAAALITLVSLASQEIGYFLLQGYAQHQPCPFTGQQLQWLAI